MRTRTTTLLAVLAVVGAALAPAASAANPEPGYVVKPTMTLDEEGFSYRFEGAAVGRTLFLARSKDLLAVDIDTGDKRSLGQEHLDGKEVLDLAVHDGKLYVLAGGAVVVLSPTGELVGSTSLGTISPNGRIDVAPDGTVFVIGGQAATGRLIRIAPNGVVRRFLPGNVSSTWDPTRLADSQLDVAATDEHVLITDNYSDTLRIFDHAGEHLVTIGEPRTKFISGGYRPVDVDAQGLVYLSAIGGGGPITIAEVVTGPEGVPALKTVDVLPLVPGGAPSLSTNHGAPAIADGGTLLVPDGKREQKPTVQRLEPAPGVWREPVVTGPANPGATLTATTGLWPTGHGSLAVQWLRDGAEIPGASSARYQVTWADLGARLSVRVTADYGRNGRHSASSAPVEVTLAPGQVAPEPEPESPGAPQQPGGSTEQPLGVNLALVDAKVSRSTKPRLVVFVWGPDAPSGRVVVREGSKVLARTTLSASHQGARTITLPRLKVGKHRLTATSEGHGRSVTSVARTLTVTKAKPKVTVKLQRSTVAVGARAKATVRVTVTGIARPTGSVVLRDGKKKIATVRLRSAHKGKVTVRLPKLAAGKHRITAGYTGNSQVAAKRSAAKVLRVTR